MYFEPCGYITDDQGGIIADTKASPHFDHMYVHRSHVVGIFEVERIPEHKGPICTNLVLVNGIKRPVIGSIQEVLQKLRGGK